jgi:hypothetical protein
MIINPIPVSVKNVAAVRGAVWKVVSCTHCQQRFAYLLELEAIGEDHNVLFLDPEGSAQRAQAKAEHNLQQQSRNCVLPVPCPTCGFYQEDMAKQLKEGAWTNAYQVAGALIAMLSLIPLAFSIDYNWVLTLVLAVAGLALLSYGYVLSHRYDPNAGDPGPRKELGRRHAVWGERLAELLATNPNVPPGESASQPRGPTPPSDGVKPA